MKTWQVTAPNGKTYVVEGADDSTQEQALEFVKQQMALEDREVVPEAAPQRGSILDSAIEGATLGWSSELAGLGARAAHELYKHFPSDAPMADYRAQPGVGALAAETAQQAQGADLEAYRQRNPYLSAATEIASGIASGGPIAKLAKTGLGFMGMGALEGALAGAGIDEENRARGMVLGGTFGGLMGGAIPAAQWFGRHVTSPIYQRIMAGPASTAGRVLGDALDADQVTPQMLMRRQAKFGPDATLTDIGGARVEGLAQGVIDADATGEALAKARRVYGPRKARSGRVVREAVSESTGVRGRLQPVLDELIKTRKQDAGELYKAAYAFQPDPTDRELISILNRPGVRKALPLALENAANKGRQLPVLESIVAKGGDWQPGVEVFPDMESLDQVKRTLYRMYNAAYKNDPARATALKRAHDDLKGLLVKRNGAYGEALNRYAGQSAVKDAMLEGEKFMNRKTREVTDYVSGLGESEREAYLTGAVEAIRERMGKAAAGDVSEYRFLRQGGVQEKLRAFFPNTREGKRAYVGLMRTIQAQARGAQTYGLTVGGSQTAMRRAGGEVVRKQTALPTTAEAIENPISSMVRSLATKSVEAMQGMSQRSIQELSTLLFEPNKVESVIRELRRRGVEPSVINRMVNHAKLVMSVGPAAGVVAGAGIAQRQ